MKTIYTGTAMLLALSIGMVVAIDAATSPAFVPAPATITAFTPMSVLAGALDVAPITVPVVITAKRPAPVRAVRQDASCAFGERALLQGSGSVRGFCTR